jgi:acyl dehydratase
MSEIEKSRDDGMVDLDASDLDNWMGQPMDLQMMREPVAVNDIRRWVQGMHYANPLHFDEKWAAESRFGQIVAPYSFTVSTDTAHGCMPSNMGNIPNSHLIFGGDEWWFFGPRIFAGDHLKCYPVPFDYKVTDTSFAGPTCFQRGDTTYVNQQGDRVAMQRSTAIRYVVENAHKMKVFSKEEDRDWSTEELLALEDVKQDFIQEVHNLGHDKRLYQDVEVGKELTPNVLGPHSLASFTTEWRAYPQTIWYGGLRSEARQPNKGYTPEMEGFEGDPIMEKFNPELTDGAYYGPSRGHLQPKWARHVGMGRGYGYGASMGAWMLDYASAFVGEWGELLHAKFQYRNPAFTGDITYLNGSVIDKQIDQDGRAIISIDIDMKNQDDDIMAKGVVKVILPQE